MKETFYKIYVKRVVDSRWVDRTTSYSYDGKIDDFDNAMEVANSYKECHIDENVKIIKFTTEEILV